MKPKQHRIRKGGKLAYVTEFAFDPNPLYACDVLPSGHVDSTMAFDTKYGPENEAQIEYHALQGHLDTSAWKVGEPV